MDLRRSRRYCGELIIGEVKSLLASDKIFLIFLIISAERIVTRHLRENLHVCASRDKILSGGSSTMLYFLEIKGTSFKF